jgi:hypothetical protein
LRAVDLIVQLNRLKMQFGLANLQWVRTMTRDHQILWFSHFRPHLNS